VLWEGPFYLSRDFKQWVHRRTTSSFGKILDQVNVVIRFSYFLKDRDNTGLNQSLLKWVCPNEFVYSLAEPLITFVPGVQAIGQEWPGIVGTTDPSTGQESHF
jgi:hypothetical protein